MLPSVTNTLINGTTINGSQIDKNFNDILSALNSGTKDILVNKIECTSLSTNLCTTLNATLTGAITSVDTEVTANSTIATSTASKMIINIENTTIDTSNAIVPTASNLVLNSEVYQYAAFSAGIEILAGTNDKIDFIESGMTELTATIPPGTYTAAAFATAVETQLNAVGANLYAVTFHTTYFKITSDLAMSFSWRTGTNWSKTAGKNLGIFTTSDSGSAKEFTSDYDFQIAYTENLETITSSLGNGTILILTKLISSNSKVITIKNGLGNIDCGSDRVLTDDSYLILIKNTNWKLLSYSGN